MTLSIIGPSEDEIGLISDFYQGVFNTQIIELKQLIYDLYQNPEVGSKILETIKLKKEELTNSCHTYQHIMQQNQNFIRNSFDTKDIIALKRNYQQTYNEVKSINEIYVSIKIRRIAHNITYNHPIYEEIGEIKDLITNAENLYLSNIGDKIQILKEYINRKQ